MRKIIIYSGALLLSLFLNLNAGAQEQKTRDTTTWKTQKKEIQRKAQADKAKLKAKTDKTAAQVDTAGARTKAGVIKGERKAEGKIKSETEVQKVHAKKAGENVKESGKKAKADVETSVNKEKTKAENTKGKLKKDLKESGDKVIPGKRSPNGQPVYLNSKGEEYYIGSDGSKVILNKK